MILPDLTTEQIITAVIFLSVLFLFQLFIKKNKFGLKDKFSAKTRLSIVESIKLNQSEQIRIIRIDNTDYALFSNKGVQPYVLPLSKKQSKIDSHKNSKFTHQIKSPKIESSSKEVPSRNQRKTNSDSTTDSKMLRAISIARKLNPKVSF